MDVVVIIYLTSRYLDDRSGSDLLDRSIYIFSKPPVRRRGDILS